MISIYYIIIVIYIVIYIIIFYIESLHIHHIEYHS